MRLRTARAGTASALLATALLMAGLTACSTGSDEEKETPEATTAVDADAFPVTIEHVFGETTVEAEPTRVATLGWSDQDAVLSLGVIPVGSTKLTWGGNEAGSSDWFDSELEELSGEQPVRYSDADGAPIEEIAELQPDLILATNSGITEKEYEKLSKIAPTVAYLDAPWVTSWQDTLDIAGQALGRNTLADEVEAETEETLEAARADYPELQGTSFVFSYISTADLSTIGIYGRDDNRVRVMEELGLTSASIVDKVVAGGLFYDSLSSERADEVDADLLLTYAETADDVQTFTDDKLVGQIPALQAGHVYAEADKHIGLAITNPTPLSIPFLIAQYLPQVAEAAQGL